MDIGNCLACWPGLYFDCLGVVGDVSLVGAFVAKDDDFWGCKKDLGC